MAAHDLACASSELRVEELAGWRARRYRVTGCNTVSDYECNDSASAGCYRIPPPTIR
jgi:hypothetical protein